MLQILPILEAEETALKLLQYGEVVNTRTKIVSVPVEQLSKDFTPAKALLRSLVTITARIDTIAVAFAIPIDRNSSLLLLPIFQHTFNIHSLPTINGSDFIFVFIAAQATML